MRAKKQKTSRDLSRLSKPHNPKLPFIEHLLELRKRLFYVALSVMAWATAAYFVQQHIVAFLLRPAANQPFIYTSVGGGIDFLVRVCIYTGVVFSIPVIVFQVLKYLQPLIKRGAVRFIAWGSIISGVLAVAGMAFGYFLGLPAALHFLLHQFTTDQIHPLLTIQSYMSFVSLYMLGSALLFQLPLLLVLINRIKPLKPKKLLGYERWVILLAFIGGGIMNPSPRVQDQLILAVPIILAYQVGVLLVWLSNRNTRHSSKMAELRKKDDELRAERENRFREAQAALQQKLASVPVIPQAAALPAGGLPESGTPAPQVPGAATFGKPAGVRQTAQAAIAGKPAGKEQIRQRRQVTVQRRSFTDFARQPRPRPLQPRPRPISIQDSTDAAQAA